MPLSPADFDYLRTLVQQRSAIVLETDKLYLADARLLPLARREGLGSVTELVKRLRWTSSNGLHQRAVEALATNETSFFRDAAPFDFLRDTAIPQLMSRRSACRTLCFWCGACSSGQEAYSLAMILQEHFPALAHWHVRIIACDLSAGMIERARAGVYSQHEVARGVPPRFLARCFDPRGRDWQIKEPLRRKVEFRTSNLLDGWNGLPPLDVALLRNVLIYFGPDTKKQMLASVRQHLRPDGYLFLGGAESTMNLDDAFERAPIDRACCYRLRPRSATGA